MAGASGCLKLDCFCQSTQGESGAQTVSSRAMDKYIYIYKGRPKMRQSQDTGVSFSLRSPDFAPLNGLPTLRELFR